VCTRTFPDLHFFFDGDNVGNAINHLLHKFHFGESDALFVGNIPPATCAREQHHKDINKPCWQDQRTRPTRPTTDLSLSPTPTPTHTQNAIPIDDDTRPLQTLQQNQTTALFYYLQPRCARQQTLVVGDQTFRKLQNECKDVSKEVG
jgi:hypothetical protein